MGFRGACFLIGGLTCMLLCSGCGTSVQRSGTEQLLLSDAVDRAIDQLDLSPLSGRKVYLDTEYMKAVKGNMFINAEYITSALRQKMTTSGCLIQKEVQSADYVLEARVGALGADSMEVTYGIPASGGVGGAASALAGAPALPSIPEVSFGKRNANLAITKVVVYGYHRETGIPVWQSGNAIARSDAQDSWMMGMGPVTKGSVYDGVRLAGNPVKLPFSKKPDRRAKPLTIADRHNYVHPAVLEKQLADAKQELEQQNSIQPASHEQSSGEAEVPPPVPPETPPAPPAQ
ncbi:MAG: hypothetical protein JNL58_20020 [Planctomyces sp.]|nr:hypothetical protein [Planctomyces sp.]